MSGIVFLLSSYVPIFFFLWWSDINIIKKLNSVTETFAYERHLPPRSTSRIPFRTSCSPERANFFLIVIRFVLKQTYQRPMSITYYIIVRTKTTIFVPWYFPRSFQIVIDMDNQTFAGLKQIQFFVIFFPFDNISYNGIKVRVHTFRVYLKILSHIFEIHNRFNLKSCQLVKIFRPIYIFVFNFCR